MALFACSQTLRVQCPIPTGSLRAANLSRLSFVTPRIYQQIPEVQSDPTLPAINIFANIDVSSFEVLTEFA